MDDQPTINPLFASHVTSIAFNLSLTKNMVVVLTDIASRGQVHRDTFRTMGMPCGFSTGLRGLLDRGLVFAPDPKWPGKCEFTEPGKAVFALLQMAGLVQRIEDKIAERKSA